LRPPRCTRSGAGSRPRQTKTFPDGSSGRAATGSSGARIEARFFRGERGRRQIQWAERQLAERGGELIVIGRFIPGGRTALTLSAGALGYPWRRFARFDAAAVLVWALYATLLGYFGGRTFEHAPWQGLLLALAIVFAVAGGIELTRWLLKRRRPPGAATSRD
jgi:membrane-associated protein